MPYNTYIERSKRSGQERSVRVALTTAAQRDQTGRLALMAHAVSETREEKCLFAARCADDEKCLFKRFSSKRREMFKRILAPLGAELDVSRPVIFRRRPRACAAQRQRWIMRRTYRGNVPCSLALRPAKGTRHHETVPDRWCESDTLARQPPPVLP